MWLEHCFSVNQIYPYPLLNVIGDGERVAVFAGSAVMMAVCTLGIGWGYGKVNGVDVAKGVGRKKRA